MVDSTSTHARKVGGVRFTVDAADSSSVQEESLQKTNELQWEKCCDNECSFELYFGILKLSHIYTMPMHVAFYRAPVQLETILDHPRTKGLQLLVNELAQAQFEHQTNFQVEIVIDPETTPGPFHLVFWLKDKAKPEQRPVKINVRGKILREGQGTATLRNEVRMKSIITAKEDEEE